MMADVQLCKSDRRIRDVNAGHASTVAGKADEIGPGTTSHVQHTLATVMVKGDQTEKVMELVEVILVEVSEKAHGADRMLRHLQIMNPDVPIGAHGGCCWSGV